MKIFRFLITFLSGLTIGAGSMLAAEFYIPGARAKSYSCYKNGDAVFKIMVDGKMGFDDKFYPVVGVSIANLHWLYHTSIVKDTREVSCE